MRQTNNSDYINAIQNKVLITLLVSIILALTKKNVPIETGRNLEPQFRKLF